jgi:predicted DNA-binding transcriptional regulator AlpA
MSTQTTSPLLLLEDVCELVRVSPQTVRRWLKDRRFPQPIRLGRKLLWTQSAIDQVLAEKAGHAS